MNDKMIEFIRIIITSIMLKISGQLALCDFPLMTLGIRRYVLNPLEDSSISNNNNSVNTNNSNISSISITIGIKCVGEMPTSLGINEEKTCLWFLQQKLSSPWKISGVPRSKLDTTDLKKVLPLYSFCWCQPAQIFKPWSVSTFDQNDQTHDCWKIIDQLADLDPDAADDQLPLSIWLLLWLD